MEEAGSKDLEYIQYVTLFLYSINFSFVDEDINDEWNYFIFIFQKNEISVLLFTYVLKFLALRAPQHSDS